MAGVTGEPAAATVDGTVGVAGEDGIGAGSWYSVAST